MRRIGIIGGGVIGLTSALHLLRNGCHVHVFTDQKLSITTSNKAAAIWLPYLALPIESVNKWSKTSYFKYEEICKNPLSGVSLVDLTVLVNDENIWWKDSLPPSKITSAINSEIPDGFDSAYIIKSPLIETQIYLKYLAKEIISLGGIIEIKHIDSIRDIAYSYDFIVNCSGLGSIDLTNDKELYPIKGQLLKVKNQPNIRHVIADFAFDKEGQNLAYTIPRQDYLILGGTAIKGDFSEEPNSKLAEGIFERCLKISNGKLKKEEIILLDVGLRPGRKIIRLEKEGKIIHNYGHGGAGFTVSWGCAEEVFELITSTL
jgi:D-amino-acid oxidase